MEPLTLSIGVAVVVILFTAVYVISALFGSEKTYDELVAQQRKSKLAEQANNDKKDNKEKKDKPTKKEKKKAEKVKSEQVENVAPVTTPVVEEVKPKSSTNVIESKKDKSKSQQAAKNVTPVVFVEQLEQQQDKKVEEVVTKTEAKPNKNEKPKPKENVEKREKRAVLAPKGDESINTSGILSLETDVSFTKMLDLIKSIPLSNGETQVLIDVLLSKTSESPSDWINKHDPITTLKKQLEDKEAELRHEIENHQRAKNRIQDMREEINQEKRNQTSIASEMTAQLKKYALLEAKLKETEASKQSDLIKLQNDLVLMTENLREELKSTVQQVEKEKERAQQAINQYEQEKRRAELMSYQVLQFNNDRQQLHSMSTNQEKVNEDLKNENNMLKEKLSELKNTYELNEFNIRKHNADLEQRLREKEQSLDAQMTRVADDYNQQIEQMKATIFEAQSQNGSLMQQINVLEEQQKHVRNILASVKPNTEDSGKAIVEVLQELESLKQQLASSASSNHDQLQKLQQQLSIEHEKNVSLEQKVQHYEQTLCKVEQDLGKIGETANEEVSTWNQRLEELGQQFESIKQEQSNEGN